MLRNILVIAVLLFIAYMFTDNFIKGDGQSSYSPGITSEPSSPSVQSYAR